MDEVHVYCGDEIYGYCGDEMEIVQILTSRQGNLLGTQ